MPQVILFNKAHEHIGFLLCLLSFMHDYDKTVRFLILLVTFPVKPIHSALCIT